MFRKVMNNQSQHAAIIALHSRKSHMSEIVLQLGIDKRIVPRIFSRFCQLGNLEDYPGAERPTTADTPYNRNIIRNNIRRNPKWSQGNIALDIGIIEKSTRNIIKKKLKLYSYKMQKVHLLIEEIKRDRLKKVKNRKRRFGLEAHRTKLFFRWEAFHHRRSLQQTEHAGFSPWYLSCKCRRTVCLKVCSSSFCGGFVRDNRWWDDSSGFRRLKRQNQRENLPERNPPERTRTVDPRPVWKSEFDIPHGRSTDIRNKKDSGVVSRPFSRFHQ